MADTVQVRVPDLGDFKDVPVIEVLVKPGDIIKKETPLIMLESEKASMEVPSSAEGTVQSVDVKPGDKVSQGSVVVTVTVPTAASAPSEGEGRKPDSAPPQAGATVVAEQSKSIELRVPDIGDFENIPVIDVLVKPGDVVKREAPLVTLESEKASMDVPASEGGTIASVLVKPGDKVSKGTVLATLNVTAVSSVASNASAVEGRPQHAQPERSLDSGSSAAYARDDKRPGGTIPQDAGRGSEPRMGDRAQPGGTVVHASPSIRRFARELGVDIHVVRGTGPNGRITREDVQGWVKRALRDGAPAGASPAAFGGLPPWPKVDFAQFGPVERVALPRIKKFSGPNLHRNWLSIPHITNYDEADITDLEAFRNEINGEAAKGGGAKLTMLAFLVKACVDALRKFPDFNSSLDGDELVRKNYYNIGFAADTPGGLVVPVLKDAANKGLIAIAAESAELAKKARDGKLGLADMQGGTFTISSIGGIGGTQFTQIVNAPEVAILGATRAATKPVWDGRAFVPRLILPISVSYDHRVIDGAGAARFLVHLAALLKDFRRALL